MQTNSQTNSNDNSPVSKGMEFDGFRIMRKLGQGGMGEVWLARQIAMDRDVALKILSPELSRDNEFVTRFIREVKTVGSLTHPNIITAYHAGSVKNTRYLAIAYIDGVVLENRLKIDGIIPEIEALRIFRSIACALRYAWDGFQLIHRDIKPSNIMFTKDMQPMLMDLGISKSVKDNSGLTMTGAIIGTPYYMSPEQARSDKNIDCRTDIYSLGATLYHMVTGSVPYDASSTVGVITKLISEPLPPPQGKNPRLSETCAAFIELVMAKNPDQRPTDWEAAIADCDRVINGSFPAKPLPKPGDSMVKTMPTAVPLNMEQNKTMKIKDIHKHSQNKEIHMPASLPASKKSGQVVGIDLGTTFSAVAWMNENGNVEVVPNSDGHTTTPSVVFLDNEVVLVGREAARATLLEPEKGAECFKRDIGQALFGKKVAGKQLRPENLSAYVLKKLKQDAEEKIGKITDAVITVPAYFDDSRRQATIDAGKIAGLNVLEIINEPSAAALWYAYRNQEVAKDEIFLIYDLGGGTFDATLMRCKDLNSFETVATDGDVMLGGKDWDKRLIDHIAGEFMKKAGADPREDDTAYLELAQRVEEAKRALSKRTSVAVPVTYAGKQLRIQIDRDVFRDLTSDLLGRTQTTVELLIDEAGLQWNNINRIITVGGASRMVMVREMLESVSGKSFDMVLDPDLAVVQGAAVYAAALTTQANPENNSYHPEARNKLLNLKHRNVNSHSLGVEVENEKNGEPENFIIISKNTPIPCEKSTVFGLSSPSSDSSSAIKISILEGESLNPEACVQIGNCVISDLPPGLPAGSPVEISFSYTQDGRIHVKAVATEVNREASTFISRKNGLNQENFQEITQVIGSQQIV